MMAGFGRGGRWTADPDVIADRAPPSAVIVEGIGPAEAFGAAGPFAPWAEVGVGHWGLLVVVLLVPDVAIEPAFGPPKALGTSVDMELVGVLDLDGECASHRPISRRHSWQWKHNVSGPRSSTSWPRREWSSAIHSMKHVGKTAFPLFAALVADVGVQFARLIELDGESPHLGPCGQLCPQDAHQRPGWARYGAICPVPWHWGHRQLWQIW